MPRCFDVPMSASPLTSPGSTLAQAGDIELAIKQCRGQVSSSAARAPRRAAPLSDSRERRLKSGVVVFGLCLAAPQRRTSGARTPAVKSRLGGRRPGAPPEHALTIAVHAAMEAAGALRWQLPRPSSGAAVQPLAAMSGGL